MTMTEVVAKNIKRYRENKNWYQDDLALKLGVSQKAVSAWETGKSCPRAGVVSKMCELFGCTMTDIMSDSSEIKLKQLATEAAQKVIPSEDEDEQRIIKIYRSLSNEKKRELLNKAIDLMVQ